MGRLKIYDQSKTKEEIQVEREQEFLNLRPSEKFFRLLKLNKLAVTMNGGKPLKVPQGKGLIIKKKY